MGHGALHTEIVGLGRYRMVADVCASGCGWILVLAAFFAWVSLGLWCSGAVGSGQWCREAGSKVPPTWRVFPAESPPVKSRSRPLSGSSRKPPPCEPATTPLHSPPPTKQSTIYMPRGSPALSGSTSLCSCTPVNCPLPISIAVSNESLTSPYVRRDEERGERDQQRRTHLS